MTRRIVVAIDDTDGPEGAGTVDLARRVATEVEASGLGRSLGVTRHRCLASPDAASAPPSTAAAVLIETEATTDAIEACVRDVVVQGCAPGSHPGLAILERRAPGVAVAFARRVQNGPVSGAEAERIASMASIRLRRLGGSGEGIVGALAAGTLRFEGNDGWFVGLPGTTGLPPRMRVADIYAAAPLDVVLDEASGKPAPEDAVVEVSGPLSPRLIDGRAMLLVRRSDADGTWVLVDGTGDD